MEAREDCVKMVSAPYTPYNQRFHVTKVQLMNIFDTDRSGSINFMEFEGLYRYIKVSTSAVQLIKVLTMFSQHLCLIFAFARLDYINIIPTPLLSLMLA